MSYHFGYLGFCIEGSKDKWEEFECIGKIGFRFKKLVKAKVKTMQYSDENNFTKEFFQRTIYNLKLYEHHNKICKEVFKYEVTQLINSLLGLIVFVKEDSVNFTSIKLSDIIKADKIRWQYYDINGGKPEEKNLKNFLRHLRNAIAHKRLTIKSNANKEISTVIFEDKNRRNKFRVELTIKEIKHLIKQLSSNLGEN